MPRFVLSLALSAVLASAAGAAEQGEVLRTPSCGCCHAWAEHMKSKGFNLTLKDLPRSELNAQKVQLGVGGKYASCHTAKLGGYVIEGHVPAADVQRLLDTRPDAIGLSVPGMPVGSPGMESGNEREAFDVLLVKKDGSSEVFASYGAGTPSPAAD